MSKGHLKVYIERTEKGFNQTFDIKGLSDLEVIGLCEQIRVRAVVRLNQNLDKQLSEKESSEGSQNNDS